MAKKITKRQTEVPMTGAFGIVVVFVVLLYVLERRHYDGLIEVREISEMMIYTDTETGYTLQDQGDVEIYGGVLYDMFSSDSLPPSVKTADPEKALPPSSTVGKLVAIMVTEETPISLKGLSGLNDDSFGAIDWPTDTARTDRITQVCLADNTWTLLQTGDLSSQSFFPTAAQIGYYELQGKGLRRVAQSGKPVDDLHYDLSKSVFRERQGTKWLYEDENSNEQSCVPDTKRVMHLASQLTVPFTVLAMHAGDGKLDLYDYGDPDRPIFKSRPGTLGRRQLFREEIGSVKRITQVLRMISTGTSFLFLCIAGISVFQAGLISILAASSSIGFFDWWFWGLGDFYMAVSLTLPVIILLVVEYLLRSAFNRHIGKKRPVAQASSGKSSPAAAQRKKKQ